MDKRIMPEPYFTNSRQLRKSETPWEAKLWYYLRAGRFYELKFKRQVLVGLYIYDFSCRAKMLIIELDGGHHSESNISAKDSAKQSFAELQGYKVLRFWNNELDENIEGVLSSIKKVCNI